MAAGTDWHGWWAGERQRFWRTHRRGATATGDTEAAATAADWRAVLRARLESGSAWTDRAALAEGLAYLRDPMTLDLALRLAADRNDRVSRSGVFAAAAAMHGQTGALTALRAVLEDRGIEDRPRGAAAAALGGLGDPAACDVLWRTARAPLGPIIRTGALIGLGFAGGAAVVSPLQQVLADRREEAPVRVAAAAALGQLALTEGARRAATTALLDAIRNPKDLSVDVRQTVALNLGNAESSALVVRRLCELVTDEGDARTRCCAALALGCLARRAPDVGERARRALVSEWDKEAPEVRAFLALGLGLGGISAERRRLEGWLEGRGDPLHRGAAAIALGLLADEASLASLARAAISGAPSLRGDACEAMGLLGGPRAAAALRELTMDGPDAARGAALYAIGCIGQASDLGGLTAYLDAPTPDLRMGSVWGLAAFGGADARDRLLAHAAREADPPVRALACFGAMLAMADRPFTAPGKDVDRSPWAREH